MTAVDGAVRRRTTPVRQFQVVGLVHGALFAWTGLYVHAPRHYTGGLERVLAGLGGGGFGDRFYSVVVAVLAWGHVPVVYLLALWGVVLALGSIRGRAGAGYDPGRIPTVLLFWGSLTIAGTIRGIAGTTAGAHSFMGSEYYGVAFGGFWVWLTVALTATVVAAVRAIRGIPSPDAASWRHTRAARTVARRSQRRTSAGRPQRRPYSDLALLARTGHADELTQDERDVVGAGAGGSAVAALLLGIFGLGPAGLVPAIRAVRRGGPASWVARTGLLLCAASTAIIVVALLLAALG
ncbi:hypothetical protein [Georgenia daeguensis]|uniref:DUF1206 domain-containing protein n=1 Tax=Georgenia daeguensis TaxID=908355 RepID=A0ABP8EQE1_9MICO